MKKYYRINYLPKDDFNKIIYFMIWSCILN